MLEITPDDIAGLADDDLRSLVALLCETEMRRRQLPSSAVTWGGHQDAADGGIDVRVDLPAGTAIKGYIPRAATGLQAKKPDMPASAIVAEMRPKGVIRPSIQDLASRGGAYIIASTAGSVSDDPLSKRRAAMAEAVHDIPNGASLKVDFYDRTRLASWVRDHPGLIPWVRQKAGRPLVGWQAYGPWAYPAEGVTAEYLMDDTARIHTGRKDDGEGVTVAAGIARMRDTLRVNGKIVRLVGLSGVGKTRLVQALFDGRVGEQSLDPSLVLYTNMADAPDPPPIPMVSDLIAAGTRAIVVVDNCPSDLHRRLAEVCGAAGSKVSTITVEYDIREDQPEATEVFALESSSIELTEKLVRHRFPDISQVDARTVAEFSGGNARIAIALATTVGRDETISGLSDDELFQRLFQQRHGHDEALLLAAEACALVYSFEGEDVADGGELSRLGRLVGQDAASVYRAVAELKRRDLVQQRSVWRAVLPHAIAIRLATLALQNISLASIDGQLVSGAPERLTKSFSRRLGYLHDSADAICIVGNWLAPGGLLSDVADFDELHTDMFENVAPAAPEATVAALERALAGPKASQLLAKREEFVRLIRSLAYEPQLFERCAELLVRFAVEGGEQEAEAANALVSLCFAYLSGTYASVEQRLRVVESLLRSSDPKKQALGISALGALLEAWHFMSSYDFQFGSRSRDHGYWPTLPQRRSWYATVLRAAEAIACSDLPVAPQVQGVIAEKLRGLWTMAHMHDDLERVIHAISAKGFWREGWIAVRQTLGFDAGVFAPKVKAHLVALEQILRPTTLLQRVQSIVLSQKPGAIDLDEYEDDGNDVAASYARTEALAEALGEETAKDAKAFVELLPELVSGQGRLPSFGRGLAAGAESLQAVWDALVGALAGTPEGNRNMQVLGGFIEAVNQSNPHFAASLLGAATSDTVLGPRFPWLQCMVPIDAAGVDRVRRSLTLGMAQAEVFQCLAWGRSHETISGRDLKDLVQRIAAKPSGVDAGLAGWRSSSCASSATKVRSDTTSQRSSRPAARLLATS